MDDGCQIVGLGELNQLFKDMGEKLVKTTLKDCLDYAGAVMQEAAIQAAPVAAVGTKEHPAGQLKLDIRRKVFIDIYEGIGECVVYPSRHSFYAMFSEFGTSREPQRAWLRPSFLACSDQVFEAFTAMLAAHIQEFEEGK